MNFVNQVRARLATFSAALVDMKAKINAVIPALKHVNNEVHSIDRCVIPLGLIESITKGLKTIALSVVGGALLNWLTQSFQKGGMDYAVISPILIAVVIAVGIKEFMTQRLTDRMVVFEEAFSERFYIRKMNHLSTLDLATLLSPDFDKKERLMGEGRYVLRSLFDNQFELISALVSVVTGLGALLVIDPLMLLVVTMPIIPSLVMSSMQTQADRKYKVRRQMHERRNFQYLRAVSDPEGLAQSKMFGMVEYFKKKYFLTRRMFMRFSRLKLRRRTTGKVLLQMLQVCAINGVLLYLVAKASRSGNPMMNMMVVVGSLSSLQLMLSRIPHLCLRMVQSVGNEYSDIQNFFNTRPQINEDNCKDFVCQDTPVVEMRNVCFTYPHTDKEVISSCSANFIAGDRVALVGPNGSGKTTVTMLLSKMYLPNSGDITFDGTSLSELKQLSLYRHLVYLMPQASVERMPLDISLTGVARDSIDYTRLERALALVGMDGVVKNLPKGYQTQIGVNWGGVSFSTGQFQRLMIAATLYRAFDPAIKIVIFDEPMAHCDVEIKRMFYDNLKEFSEKIVLVIAHDPLYLSFFNRVISMKSGRIVADVRGTRAISDITESVIQDLAVDL